MLVSLPVLLPVRGHSRFWNNGEDDGNEGNYSVGVRMNEYKVRASPEAVTLV